MLNQINKILKLIYVWLGFKLSYNLAELFFPNRIIYAAMLMERCYTMKQFRIKNEILINHINAMGFNEKYKITSVRQLSDYLKSSMMQEHTDKINKYIKEELGINLD